jgi:hypothetical protein
MGDTKTSTMQAVVGLLENAFVKAILPGFDRQVGVSEKRGGAPERTRLARE